MSEDLTKSSIISNDISKQFSWVPIYYELAQKLINWQERQGDLISFLEQLRSQDLKITPLTDKDEKGDRFLLKEIDPFTFFGVFNRGIRQEQRLAILNEVKKKFDLQSPLPDDFNGIPVLNNQNSWFISYLPDRRPEDVSRLWKVFRLALGDRPLEKAEFLSSFDDALSVRYTNLNLTVGLFWIRPDTFLNLDSTNRKYLKVKLPPGGLTAQFYRDTVQSFLSTERSFPELSFQAWKSTIQEPPPPPDNNFWLVGAYWSDNDPADQTQRFLDENIWQNGWEDRYLDEVRSMKVGDKIGIKATSTQRHNLPFDAKGKTVSLMTIKAVGTIVANRKDGRTVEVEWDHRFDEKIWYFYTYRATIWRLRRDTEYRWREYVEKLIEFVWYGKPQDYDWFCKRWFDTEAEKEPISDGLEKLPLQPYGIEDIISSGVFLTEPELKQTIDRLRSKKNLILQGPPGVGKTFIARKLAYALMEEIADQRIEMVQFHQSYSYEDFIRGYRPLPDQAGTFGLQDGIFYKFCQRVKEDPDRPYVFIIDEINRGNLSQIFGELLMLIEADKRGPENNLPLVYHKKDEPRFYVPKNLYLIGLMNLADRSLAMVDYALRRRFAFMSLKPQFKGDLFSKWLIDRGMSTEIVGLIVDRMAALNQEIAEDNLLGENYQIGHSYFCPKGNNFDGLDRNWYEAVVQTEIIPLLKEYWFDNSKRAEQIARNLLAL
jgi:5-methylcytosine-specific restriction protein B